MKRSKLLLVALILAILVIPVMGESEQEEKISYDTRKTPLVPTIAPANIQHDRTYFNLGQVVTWTAGEIEIPWLDKNGFVTQENLKEFKSTDTAILLYIGPMEACKNWYFKTGCPKEERETVTGVKLLVFNIDGTFWIYESVNIVHLVPEQGIIILKT